MPCRALVLITDISRCRFGAREQSSRKDSGRACDFVRWCKHFPKDDFIWLVTETRTDKKKRLNEEVVRWWCAVGGESPDCTSYDCVVTSHVGRDSQRPGELSTFVAALKVVTTLQDSEGNRDGPRDISSIQVKVWLWLVEQFCMRTAPERCRVVKTSESKAVVRRAE